MALLGICDPGHGGFDPGAVGNGLREADLTWDFGQKFAGHMERSGVKIFFTRDQKKTATGNTKDELAYRFRFANDKGGLFYLSFHINAGGGSGFESYRYPRTDEKTIRLQQLVHGKIAAVFSQHGMPDRGMKTADFAVLRGTKMPAVLLELGFIDHAGDARIIHSPDFQDQVAQAAARGVCEWLNISYINEETGTSITGEARATVHQLAGFARSVNPTFPLELASLYLETGKRYGIRGDIAFAQMLLETGYFRFVGNVKKEQNNFAGIGAVKDGAAGASFKTMAEGVIAHFQHLYAYCTTAPLPPGESLLDPRFHLVIRGSALTWEALNGKWAVPGTTYGQDILAIYLKILAFKGHWAEKEIARIIQTGIMENVADGNFYPDRLLTRAELAVALCRLLEKINQTG